MSRYHSAMDFSRWRTALPTSQPHQQRHQLPQGQGMPPPSGMGGGFVSAGGGSNYRSVPMTASYTTDPYGMSPPMAMQNTYRRSRGDQFLMMSGANLPPTSVPTVYSNAGPIDRIYDFTGNQAGAMVPYNPQQQQQQEVQVAAPSYYNVPQGGDFDFNTPPMANMQIASGGDVQQMEEGGHVVANEIVTDNGSTLKQEIS